MDGDGEIVAVARAGRDRGGHDERRREREEGHGARRRARRARVSHAAAVLATAPRAERGNEQRACRQREQEDGDGGDDERGRAQPAGGGLMSRRPSRQPGVLVRPDGVRAAPLEGALHVAERAQQAVDLHVDSTC